MFRYVLLLLISVVDIFYLDSVLVDYLVIATFLLTFTDFLRNLSRKINFFDIVGTIGSLIYLIAPLVTYTYFSKSNPIAKLWGTFMSLPKDEYFAYALPGTLMLIIGLNYSASDQRIQDQILLDRCREYLRDKKYIGFMFIIIGLVTSVSARYLPLSLDSILYYFKQLTYIGVLYVMFSGVRSKSFWLIMGLGLLVAQSVVTAMYSEMIFWCVFGGIILLVGKKKNIFFFKFSLIFIGAFGIIVIQSIKHEYRKDISTGSSRGSDPAEFYNLIKERVSDPLGIFTPERNFSMIARANQGLFVGRVMEFVPAKEKFANGETIIKSVAASLVPRFVWPDKPESGGREKVCRFLGDCRKKKFSYNIGQLGEAYVNFGRVGGILFMFVYGWFIRLTYNKLSSLSVTNPSLILWVPFFYFMVLSLETDVITFLNAFMKAVIFAVFCFFSLRWFLNIRL